MEKKFSHNPNELCGLCHKKIDTKVDKWVSVVDLDGKKVSVVKFYHNLCLNDLIKGKGQLIRENFQNKLKQFTKNMLDSSKQSPEKLQINLDALAQ